MNIDNSFIYLSKDRRALADKVILTYQDDILKANLIYKKGKISFKLKDNILELYGENFNDEFMQNLFALSRFEGGFLNFYIYGPIDNYKGILIMENTKIHKFNVLNNVLAFVNTIPSLITFSVPGYSSKGLTVDNAYANFELKDKVYVFDDIYMESKELKVLGEGNASIKYNSINLDLNLKTDLGSSASKIPVVGYIIFGEDSISTSLKVTGKLSDPTIETQLAQDIIIAPLNIIKRTFLLPFNLFTSKEKK